MQAGIVVDVEATPAHRTQEVEATKTMLERVDERFDVTPSRLIGDTPMLGWIVEEKKLQPHIPVWDKSERDDGTFGPIGAPGGLEPRSPDSKPVCALQYSPEVPKPIGLFLISIEKGADTVVWHATAPELS